jgi:CelD/BcsL family acetyltransferase involved in cellulose biosynthesis
LLRRINIAPPEYFKVGSSIVIEQPDSWQDYRKSLSRNRREKINRSLRLLREKGTVRIVRMGLDPSFPDEELEKLVEDSLTVSANSWQEGTSAGHAISDDYMRDFYREACRIMAVRGMLDLSVLYAGDLPVSFSWGIARWPYTEISKLGFDQKFAESSPGNAHMSYLIEDSIARGGREIEFGHEFADYKRTWGTREDDLYDILLYPSRFLPIMVRLLRSLKRGFRQRLPGMMRRR